MPLDLDSAVDNLIKLGWNDDDISTVVSDVQKRADEMIKAGKPDQEVENTLKSYRVLHGNNSLPFFQPATPNELQMENFQQGYTAGVMPTDTKGAQLKESQARSNYYQNAPDISTTKLADVKPPTMMQNLMAGNLGGAIETGLRGAAAPVQVTAEAATKFLPFPGIVRAMRGEDVSKYGTEGAILDPMPEVISEPIRIGIEELRKLSPGTAKFIGDTMMVSPAFHNFVGHTITALKFANNLRYLKGADVAEALKGTPETPVDISTLRDVTPGAIKRPLIGAGPAQEIGAQNAPITNVSEVTNGKVAPNAEAWLKSKAGANAGQSGVKIPSVDPVTIEIAKSTRDFAIKTENYSLLAQANELLNKGGVPEEMRTVTPLQSALAKDAAIGMAVEAKRFGELNNAPEIIAQANKIINNNGIFKPHEFEHLDLPDHADFTADLNVVAQDKPKADFQKLQGTAVVNPDGTPKEVYHGTDADFKDYNLDFAKPGIRQVVGIWHTDNPAIASGTYARGPDTPAIKNIRYAISSLERAVKEAEDSALNTPTEISNYQQVRQDRLNHIKRLKEDLTYNRQLLVEELGTSPNVRPAYLNIKKPFDWEGRTEGEDVKNLGYALLNWANDAKQRFADRKGLSGKELENQWATTAAAQIAGDANRMIGNSMSPITSIDNNRFMEMMDSMIAPKYHKQIMMEAGFDGYTHIGGTGRYGSAPKEGEHRVWIAFEPKQVISKFDPDLYKHHMIQQVEKELGLDKYQNLNTKWLRDNNIQPLRVPNTPPEVGLDANVSMALVKRAAEKGLTISGPTFDDIDPMRAVSNNFGPPEPDEPQPTISGPPPGDPFYLPPPDDLNLRGVAYAGKWEAPISVFHKLQAESKIPFLTELHNYKQVSDANFTRMVMELDKEGRDLIKEVGKYYNPTKKNVAFRIKASDTIEKILFYDRASDQVHFKDNNGNITAGRPALAAARLNVSLEEIKYSARIRWLYDEYYRRGATPHPNQHLDFYNPKKFKDDKARFDYVQGLREDQRAFFTYPRSNRVYQLERDSLKLLGRYQLEWARTKHLIPWQKEVAEPIFQQAKLAYANVPRKNETLNYIRDYILDTLRYPLDTATNVNSAFFDFLHNRVEPLSPGLAEMIIRRFGDDRLGEAFFRETNKGFLNLFLRFRPAPALRNLMQRELLLPLLPEGNISLVKAQRALLKDPHAQDQALMTGLMPYLEGGLANTNKFDIFAHVESGNMHSGAWVIGNGITEDYNNGMSLADVKRKWSLHLYNDSIQKEFERLWREGKVGDITTLGPIDNAGWFLGRYASMITQFAKGPGEVPYGARTGPVAKSFWLFSTWTPMALDYFKNLIKQSFYGPNPARDFSRIAKLFLYLYLADRVYEGITGKNLQANPFMNLPNRAVQAPGPNLAASALSYVTSKYNEVVNGLIDEHNKTTYEWLRKQAWNNLSSAQPGLVKDIRQITGQYNEAGKKKKKVTSIEPD